MRICGGGWRSGRTPTPQRTRSGRDRWARRGSGCAAPSTCSWAIADRLIERVILAGTVAERDAALEALLPLQRKDFTELLDAMDGLPVNIRLLDPPLHEFLPDRTELSVKVALAEAAGATGSEVDADRKLLSAVNRLHESNPMLGLRGVRLGLTTPGLFALQVRAITEAAIAQVQAGKHPKVEIMVPLVGSVMELHLVRDESDVLIKQLCAEAGVDLHVPIGTMIELPARGADRTSHRRCRGLLLLRHQRPDPDHLGLLPGRRRILGVRDLPGEGRFHGVAVRNHRR